MKDLLDIKGVLLFAGIVLPWFIVISLKEKDFLRFFFVDQHFLRFLTTKHERGGPLYYFFPVLFAGLLPWSIFIPRAVIALWHKREIRPFCIWFVVVFTFFSISQSKLPPYILPAFPAIAVMLASFFVAHWKEELPRRPETTVYQFFFAALALAGILSLSNLPQHSLQSSPDIVAVLEDVKGLSLSISILSAIILCLLCIRSMQSFKRLFIILALFSVAVAYGLMFYTPLIDKLNATKELALMIKEKQAEADSFVVEYGSFATTLPFYARQRVYIAAFRGELAMGSSYPEARRFFLDEEAFRTLFLSDKKVLCVMKTKRLPLLRRLGIENVTILAYQNERCLVSNGR